MLGGTGKKMWLMLLNTDRLCQFFECPGMQYLWHGRLCQNSSCGVQRILAFFDFLGCFLARDCVWAILVFFGGLKDKFCGEIKCGS